MSLIITIRIGRESAGLLDEMGDIILPMNIAISLGGWAINTKSETIGATIDFINKFIGNDEVSTGEGMVGERGVPNVKAGHIVGRASGCLTSETFVITVTFEDSTLAENNRGANDSGIRIY
jgi:hypothetical protein